MVLGRQTYPSALFVLVLCVGMGSLLAGDVLGTAGEVAAHRAAETWEKIPTGPQPRLLGRREVILGGKLFPGWKFVPWSLQLCRA